MRPAGTVCAEPQIARLSTYRPLRYVYNAATDSFDGNITVVNRFTRDIPGPLFAAFSNLPNGSTLQNPSGVTGGGSPYITLANSTDDLERRVAQRVTIKIRNPSFQALSTFFLDYPIVVTNDVT